MTNKQHTKTHNYQPSCIKGTQRKHMFTAFACKPQDNGFLDQRCAVGLNAAHRRNTATREKLIVPSTTAAASSLAQVLPKESLKFIPPMALAGCLLFQSELLSLKCSQRKHNILVENQ